MLKGAKRKIVRGRCSISRSHLLVGLERSRYVSLENEQLLLRQIPESALRYAKVLAQHLLGRMRHPIGEEYGGVFRKIAIIKNQQELSAVRTQALDRMRNSRREIPKVAFSDVGYEALPFSVNG